MNPIFENACPLWSQVSLRKRKREPAPKLIVGAPSPELPSRGALFPIEWNTFRVPLNLPEWAICVQPLMTSSGTGGFRSK